MRKTIFTLALVVLTGGALLTGLSSFAQDAKVVHDKNAVTRAAKGFHAISVSGGIDLYLEQGREEGVAISAADPAVRDHLVTEVEGGVLKIYPDETLRGKPGGNPHMKAYVTCSQLDNLRATGGSDVFMESGLHSDRLQIDLTGGSDFSGYGLSSDTSHVSATGGSDIQLTVNKELYATASGGSDVLYKGDGVVKSISSGHSGSIQKVR